MIKTITTILCFLVSFSCYSNEFSNTWYAGVSYGDKHPLEEEEYASGPTELLGKKYGLMGGYYFNRWFSLESGYVQYEPKTEKFCDVGISFSSNECIYWKRETIYSFVGLKGSLRMARDKLAISWRLAHMFGKYESNIDSQSFNRWYPSVGINWYISEKLALGLDGELIKYPIGAGQNKSSLGVNLVLTMKL